MEKEKESVKDAPSFDCPSFDLGLTPTPPDVNIDAVVEPMLEITNEQKVKMLKNKFLGIQDRVDMY